MATTRFRWPTSSPPTAIRRRSAKSTPTASATPIGCRGTHRRNDVRLRHRDEPHRRDQHRPQRRELRLDEARRLLRERQTGRGGALNEFFPLPAEILDGREKDGFTYPVAIYDHDEGRAVTGGFAYHGRIAALRGKFVFGDIQRGRLFAADLAAMKKADDGIPQTVAPVEEIQLYVRDASGNRVDVSLPRSDRRRRWAPSCRAPICTSARAATASCSSRRDRTA